MKQSGREYYEYSPIIDRPELVWPNSARLAVWVVPNIEFYELLPPASPGRSPWPRPQPDILHYSLRDYGNRVGIWRLFEILDRYGVRGSVALNVAVADHHPEIIAACLERGWELLAHGIYNTRYPYGMDEEQEREMIEDAIATVKRCAGTQLRGWLSPALSPTERTYDLLADLGIWYTCDFLHDDQPFPVNVRGGRLISLPYSIEVNDGSSYLRWSRSPHDYGAAIKAQFEQLYEEGAESGRVMCIPLHPFLSGQPHRLQPLAEALEHIMSHPAIWMATGAEIAGWYYAHAYDRVMAYLASRKTPPPWDR